MQIKNPNRESMKQIIVPFALSLVFLNLLYFSFFFKKSYSEFSIQTELKASDPTQVWYVYKNKYSEDRFFSEKKQLSENKTTKFDFGIKSDQEIDYIGLFWLAEEGSNIQISSYRYTINDKSYEFKKNRSIIHYVNKGSLLKTLENSIMVQSTNSRRNWVMLNDATKLNDIRDYRIHALIPWAINIFLGFILFMYFIFKKDKKLLNVKKLELSFEKVKIVLLIIWVFILPFWVIVSHSLMVTIALVTFIENYRNKKLTHLSATFKKNILFIAFYFWIIISSLITSTSNQVFDNLLDYSYFLLMPIVFQGLSKQNLSLILSYFEKGLLVYCILFLIFAGNNYFRVNPDYSFVKFLELNIELFWHTSYLSALFLMLFVGKLKERIKGNYKLLLFYATALAFMYLINARIPFIVGIILLAINIYNSLERRSFKMGLLIFTMFISLAGITFFLLKEPLKNSKGKNLVGDINNLDARLSIWSSSLSGIKSNFIFGVGSGNTVDIISNSINDNVNTKFRNFNSHNQFLEIFLGHGFMAFILLLLIFYKLYKTRIIFAQSLMFCWLLLFFVESYFQRQAGIIFFTFWYCFFINFDLLKDEDSHK